MRNLEQSERLERLRRYSDDLHAMMADGSFYRKSYLERRKLIRRVKKLYNRLAGSSPYLKPVLTAAGVLALNTACFGPFSENPIVLPDNRTGGSDDPGAQVGAPVGFDLTPYFEFRGSVLNLQPVSTSYAFDAQYGPDWGEYSYTITERGGSAFVDLDGDGDLDAIHSGTSLDLTYRYYPASESFTIIQASEQSILTVQWNQGTREEPAFGDPEPLPAETVPAAKGGIAFADMDGDGDLDLWMRGVQSWSYVEGGQRPTTVFLENTGTATAPFFEVAGTYFGPAPYYVADIRAADIDGDGDIDLLMSELDTGEESNVIRLVRNNGTSTNPDFDFTNSEPLSLGADESYLTGELYFELVDIDLDGDLDLITAEHRSPYYGPYVLDAPSDFRILIPRADAYLFVNQDGVFQPPITLDGVVRFPSGSEYPQLVDIDGDSDLDIIMTGREYSEMPYIEPGSATLHENLVLGGENFEMAERELRVLQ